METPENKQKLMDSLQSEAANLNNTKGGGPGDGYVPLEELATTDPDTFGKLHNALNSGDPAAAGWAFDNVNGRWEHHFGYFAYPIDRAFPGKEGMGID